MNVQKPDTYRLAFQSKVILKGDTIIIIAIIIQILQGCKMFNLEENF